MKLKRYIELLRCLKPSEESLLKSGFTSIPNSIVKNFIPDNRGSDYEGSSVMTGLIFELFNEFDPQYIRFADFSFYSFIKKEKDLFIFSGSSYSELAFKDITSEVIEYDREEKIILNYCAKNIEVFLEALLTLFEMYSLRIQKKISRADIEINREYVEKCTQIAGGYKYRRFYEEVIG